MPEPRVSVVIPAYNHGRYVAQCLSSVLDCDLELEVVVVDDGSSDETLERIEQFRADPRLAIYRQDNRGAHEALNRAVSLAGGELVFVLNSDDLFEPERIPCFVERFDARPDLAVLCSWLRIIDHEGAELGIKRAYHNLPPWPSRPGPSLSAIGEPALAMLETNFVSTTSNVAFRRRLFTEQGVRFRPLRYAHDWEFILSACRHGELEIVEQPLVSYRVHGSNTIGEGRLDDGRGRMRFEILWVVARHALAICRRFEERGHDARDLERRLWSSLPDFGHETLLARLLCLRGTGREAPPVYDRMISPHHPFSRRAIRALAAEDGG